MIHVVEIFNKYPPNLPTIMKSEVKKVTEQPVDKDVAEHRWRMKNDPEYVKRRKEALDQFRQKLAEYDGDKDD